MLQIKNIILTLLCSLLVKTAGAQYAPQAGVPGSTAISATSAAFSGWANHCSLQRGFLDIDTPSLGYVSNGDSSMALGAPDHSVVSLGDSGVATITFAGHVYDDAGPDFAIFENGFINPANDSQAFLELAFVEVSSDGINYTRFPTHSLTQNNTQLPGAGAYMYANLIDGFAGKYGTGYGTPFDLADLASSTHLDKNNITHIRIVDVIGSIAAHASRDITGRIINDPYPTSFPTGGFDLDAVGGIHFTTNAAPYQTKDGVKIAVYPNPTTDILHVDIASTAASFTASLVTVTGQEILRAVLSASASEFNLSGLPKGLYLLIIQDATGNKWVEKVTTY